MASTQELMLDIAVIQDLVYRERAHRDRDDWIAMRSAYIADARVRVTWFDGTIDEYVEASRNPEWDASQSQSTHRLSPSVVTVVGDRAVAETPARVELRLTVDGVLVDLIASVRLISRVVRAAEGWKLASMDAIYEKDSITPVYPGDRLHITAEQTAAYRPSYRFLAYGAHGHLPDDIPGDDRPDLVNALYAANEAWLNRGGAAPRL
jgi:hypothetical protein